MDRRINIVEREVTREGTRLFLKYAVHVLNRASISSNEKLFDCVYISLSFGEIKKWYGLNFPDVVSLTSTASKGLIADEKKSMPNIQFTN